MTRESTRPESGLLYVIKQLELVSRARLDALVRPAGMTALQYTALSVLADRPMTSSDLARASFVRPQSAAELVAGLERRGLIERAPDPAHRRRLLIALTPSGRELLAEYSPQVAALEAEMLSTIDARERTQFRDYLQRARRALGEADPPR